MADNGLAKQRGFLLEVEQGVRLANSEIIQQRIPDRFMEITPSFAVSVVQLGRIFWKRPSSFRKKSMATRWTNWKLKCCIILLIVATPISWVRSRRYQYQK